jgi:hypothetical protein
VAEAGVGEALKDSGIEVEAVEAGVGEVCLTWIIVVCR